MDAGKTIESELDRAAKAWGERDPEAKADDARSFRAGARWLAREIADALPPSARRELERLLGGADS